MAGGNNNSICMYDIDSEVLLKRFIVSENMSLDGTLQFLNSKKITDAGINSDLIDRDGELSDLEDRIDNTIPGSRRGGDQVNVRPDQKSELQVLDFLQQQLRFQLHQLMVY